MPRPHLSLPADEPGAAPAPSPPPWRRAWAAAQRLRRPLLVLAGAGTVVGGLAGYWNAYRAARDAGGPAPAVAVPAIEASARTIAVLPFANLGDRGDGSADAAFADGVGEELVNLLARVKGLRVTARRSALQFKGQTLPTPEVAKSLQAAYLVDGSVRRTGEHLRISAQLVEGRSGTVLWSGQFDREMNDAMTAQSELALQIARSLKLPLDASTLAGSGTKNVKAWQLFIQAQRLPPGQRAPLYREALVLDPAFARAHVELAEEEMSAGGPGRESPAIGAKMVPHLEAALRIDPRLALAYGRLATAAALRDDIDAMRRHAAKALELDPGDMAGHHWSAELALKDARMDDALAIHREMVELEPLQGLPYLHLAELLRLAQRPQAALVTVDQALLLQPAWKSALVEKSRILLALGRRDEALALARQRQAIEVFGLAGSAEDLAAVRQRSGLSEHQLAALAFFEGRYDPFFDHFERDDSEFMDRNRALFDPMFDRVRDHPRFRAWLAKYGMEQAHERAQAWRAANPAPR